MYLKSVGEARKTLGPSYMLLGLHSGAAALEKS